MKLILIFIIIAAIVIYSMSNSQSANDISNTHHTENIDKNFADNVIKFFDSYLSICKNKSISATCALLGKGKQEDWIQTEITCRIFSINGEHADEELDFVKGVWGTLRKEKMDSGDYLSVSEVGDRYIKEYFGCDNLHYAFTDMDEYRFENRQAIVSCNANFCTAFGAQWMPTLNYIKRELQKKWETATLSVGKNGIIVEP